MLATAAKLGEAGIRAKRDHVFGQDFDPYQRTPREPVRDHPNY